MHRSEKKPNAIVGESKWILPHIWNLSPNSGCFIIFTKYQFSSSAISLRFRDFMQFSAITLNKLNFYQPPWCVHNFECYSVVDLSLRIYLHFILLILQCWVKQKVLCSWHKTSVINKRKQQRNTIHSAAEYLPLCVWLFAVIC